MNEDIMMKKLLNRNIPPVMQLLSSAQLLSSTLLVSSTLLLSATSVNAADLDLATKPLYTGTTESPMMMLVMGRDHTLYYEAYNDASDLNGDGILDIKFMPDYAYEGYFDSRYCYKPESNIFVPQRIAATCTASEEWSGNFLNYLTMTRMDVLRKVLYGGTRSTDDVDKTILERVFIPQDAHSWGKAYTSIAVDGYDIADYAPLSVPDSGKQHFFGSVTYGDSTKNPILRIRKNVNDDVWNWASSGRPVLKKSGTDYVVRVEICKEGFRDNSNCKLYPNGNYKPTGLLHNYGEQNQMLFGLLTGSYNKNLSGGVLRKAIGQFSAEVNEQNGQYIEDYNGIVATINKLRIHGFNSGNQSYNKNCGWITDGPISDGKCASWGNPTGEMLYEAMRYFSGVGIASPSYETSGSYDEDIGLTAPAWDDPFASRGTCADPNVLLISDINPSYDSDQLPGVYSEFIKSANKDEVYEGTTLPSFSVTDLLSIISTNENKTSGQFFIGQSRVDSNGAPTAKEITGLGHVRGLAPAEPTKKGSYSSSAVAYYGYNNDIHLTKDGTQNVTTMVVALASTLPEINVEVGGEIIKIVPFAKSVLGPSSYPIKSDEGEYQPTNTIVDWYVESISSTKGIFRINFEDVEQGADHDMDMIVKYTYEVKDTLCKTYENTNCIETAKGVEITIDSVSASGSIDQHAGYVISGTTQDNTYLEVKDRNGNDVKYYLDTPTSTDFRNRKESGSNEKLGYLATRVFFPSEAKAADFLPSPLWYAAKWGGFSDINHNQKPDLINEWDTDQNGDPDNYFPVTNAGQLQYQLAAAFDLAYDGNVASTSPVFSSNFLRVGSLVYQTSFEEAAWSGDVKAYIANTSGEYPSTASWSAAEQLDAMDISTRKIFSRRDDATAGSQGTVFEFIAPNNKNELDSIFTTEQSDLLLGDFTSPGNAGNGQGQGQGYIANQEFAYIEAAINYIRGDRSHEAENTDYEFRERNSRLGDIIYSTPYNVSIGKGHQVEDEVLVFGANDGMVHVVDANNGKELVAYIPSGIYSALGQLVEPTYIHEYSTDGGITAYSDDADKIELTIDDETKEVGRTTVVGRLGLGAKGLYAMDVSKVKSSNGNMMKWEITTASTGFAGIGHSIASPTIVKLHNGETGVIFENGFNSTDPNGAIYIANLTTGALIKKLSVGSQTDLTGAGRPNALAQPAIIDNNGDSIADYIYAGDLFGNMWVFDISNESVTEWGNKKDSEDPLFTALSPTMDGIKYQPQSITTRPSVARHPSGSGVIVAFGTGKYIEKGDTDIENQATQSFYAIADHLDTAVVGATRTLGVFSTLQNQTIIKETSTNRILSSNPVDWTTVNGFYLDLINTEDDESGVANTNNYGERLIGNSLVFANKVSFTTLMPNPDVCSAGGTGWYMELNLYTGQTWNLGTTKVDDPLTAEDESIPDDSSNQFLDGVSNGMTSVVSPNIVIIENEDGTTTEVLGSDEVALKTCITLSTGKVICFDDTAIATGRLSWRHLY